MSSKCSEILQKLLEIEGQIDKQRNQKIKKYNTLNGELYLMDENSENKTKEFKEIQKEINRFSKWLWWILIPIAVIVVVCSIFFFEPDWVFG